MFAQAPVIMNNLSFHKVFLVEAINSRSNSVLRLKKNSNFKITLAKPKQDADSSAAPSFGDFKRMLKATKGFAPRIRYSHINSNELLELISQPGRALSGVGYRPNQINTYRPFEETNAENFGYSTKRSPGKSRESSPGSKMSPRNSMYLSKYSSHGGDSIFNISPSPQEKQQKVVKLRKNGFIPDLKYELDRPISFNHRYDKDIIEEPRGRLKPYKVSDKFYLESFVMKDYANRTTQELIGTYRSPQSGADSLLKDSAFDQPPSARNQSVNNSPQKFLSRRTASISGLRSASTTKLEVETVQQPIQQLTDRRELLEAYKTRQSFNSRKKLVTKAPTPTVFLTKSEKKVGSSSPVPTPEQGIIHSPKTPKTMRTLSHLDQSPGLKPQNYNDTRYALKTLRTLRSLGGGLNADDGRSPSPLKNKSTLNGFQVSVIEDSESHFHDHSFNKIHK